MAWPTGQVQRARIISVLGKLTPKRIFQYYSRRGTRVLYSILAKRAFIAQRSNLSGYQCLLCLTDARAFRFFWPLHARKPFNREEMSDLVVVQNDEIVTFF